jgi:hypothetical protein
MKPKPYNGEVRSGEQDFENLQLGAFATPGLLLAQRPRRFNSGIRVEQRFDIVPSSSCRRMPASRFVFSHEDRVRKSPSMKFIECHDHSADCNDWV